MKVRTKGPTTWALKTHRPLDGGDPSIIDVSVNRVDTNGGTLLKTYNVRLEGSGVPKDLRSLWPDEYLQATRNQDLVPVTRAALQSEYESISVLRRQRQHATQSMAVGRDVWRRIFYQMKNQRQCLRSIPRWYNHPGLFLRERYLRYCLEEISRCKDKIFAKWKFSYADLRNDPLSLRPKASFLKSHASLDKVQGFNTDVLRQGLRPLPTGRAAELKRDALERKRQARRARRREKRDKVIDF